MSMLQLLSKTAAMWYLGGEAAHIQQLQTQDIRLAGVPAVHFPDAVWHERYKARPSAAVTPDAMQPSALWIGRVSIVTGTSYASLYPLQGSTSECLDVIPCT